MFTYFTLLLLMQWIPDGTMTNPRAVSPGSYDHHHNFYAVNQDLPAGFYGEEGGAQSNEHVVYYRVKFPASAWYRVRLYTENWTWSGGCQLTVWRPQDAPSPTSLTDAYSPYYTTGSFNGAVPSTEVYLFIEQGIGYVAIDGYGPAQGKYYLHVDRAVDGDGNLVMLENPMENPVNVVYQVVVD